MLGWLCWVWTALAILGSVSSTAHAAPRYFPKEAITARAAIVIDNDSGQVLWAHNPDEPLPPASTTKVVTALLAIQSGRLEEAFRVSSEAAAAPASKIGLKPGMALRLRDLVYAVLLNSANDASVVIAEGLAGSVPAFAREMNALARRLGARNTHFVNPNGLPAEDHVSSARDLALIFRHALRHPEFEEVVSTRTGEIRPVSGSMRRIALRNHNRLLGEYHLRVVGKTGWTRAAKRCFVGAASSGTRSVSFALLGSTDLWGDIKRLLAAALEGQDWPEVLPEGLQLVQRVRKSTGGGDRVSRAQPAPSSSYAVRLGSFRDYTAAERVRSKLRRSGYPAQIERGTSKRRSVYRITVGSFDDPTQAYRVAREIRRSHRLGASVVQR
mgnify:FL=1